MVFRCFLEDFLDGSKSKGVVEEQERRYDKICLSSEERVAVRVRIAAGR